jgi:hypothetical protein
MKRSMMFWISEGERFGHMFNACKTKSDVNAFLALLQDHPVGKNCRKAFRDAIELRRTLPKGSRT